MTDTADTTLTRVPEPEFVARFRDDAPVVRSYPAGEAERTLRGLVGWPGAWIGDGVDTPDASAIVRAEDLLRSTRGIAANHWMEPHVCAATSGEVSLEWWCRSKKLTIYVAGDRAEAIRVWGADVDGEMDDVLLRGIDDVRNVWTWLIS